MVFSLDLKHNLSCSDNNITDLLYNLRTWAGAEPEYNLHYGFVRPWQLFTVSTLNTYLLFVPIYS